MPCLIAWDDSLETGHSVIDEHHKTLVAIINMLYGTFHDGVQQDKLKYILDELHLYTEYHFREEEILMQGCIRYNCIEHIAEHRLFVTDLKQYSRDICAGSEIIGSAMVAWLMGWLEEHIIKTDKELAKFVFDETNL